MSNMFGKAKESAKKPAAKSSKPAKREVEIDGLEHLASLDAAIKAFEALKKTIEEDVKTQMLREFVTHGNEAGKNPGSFRGIEGDRASASCEIRKRSSRSVLKEAEKEVLDKFGISWTTEVDTQETYVFNPKYAKDEAFLGDLAEKLEKLGLPDDLIEFQHESSRDVTTASSIDEVFQVSAKPSEQQALLKIVSTLACKPTLATDRLSEAVATVQELFAEEEA